MLPLSSALRGLSLLPALRRRLLSRAAAAAPSAAAAAPAASPPPPRRRAAASPPPPRRRAAASLPPPPPGGGDDDDAAAQRLRSGAAAGGRGGAAAPPPRRPAASPAAAAAPARAAAPAPPPPRAARAAIPASAASALASAAGRAGGAPQPHRPRRSPPSALPRPPPGAAVRLAKALADCGVASRRGAEALVAAGRVSVNGAAALLPQQPVVLGSDVLRLDGTLVAPPCRHVYLALHKPVGYLCSSAPGGHRLALDLVKPWLDAWSARNGGGGGAAANANGSGKAGANAGGGAARGQKPARGEGKAARAAGEPPQQPPRLFTVGRLDVATSGLLLVTNDGEWAQRIAHPSSGLTKEYVLTLSSAATRKQVEAVRSGCVVDGAAVRPVSVARLDPSLDGGSLHRLVVVVADGRNREVRALAESAGLGEVLTGLKRTRVGGLRLWPGPAGGVRELSAKEAREVLGGEGAGG